MPDATLLPDSIARREGAARPVVCVFASGGLDAAGVQLACGGHRARAHAARAPRRPSWRTQPSTVLARATRIGLGPPQRLA